MSQEEKKGKGKKEVTFTMGAGKLLGSGLVIMFLMVWVFILGVLTGRGDVSRVFQRLGLTKNGLTAHLGIAPETSSPVVLPPSPSLEPAKAAAEADQKPAPADKAKEAKPLEAVPTAKTGDPAPAKTAAETAKKPGPASHPEAKRPRGLVPPKTEPDPNLAAKLNFQNSLDSQAQKQAKTSAKKPAAPHNATVAPTSPQPAAPPAAAKEKKVSAYQVKVGSYRTAAEAEKTLADLRQKGFKVSLQQGKDKTGATYVIKTGRYPTKAEAEKVNQKLKEAKISGQIQELKP